MKRIQSLVTAHPRVGMALSPATETVRGQLYSLGFTPCDSTDSGIDWLVTDGAAAPADLPVLHVTGKVSIYGLTQAIIRLFDGETEA